MEKFEETDVVHVECPSCLFEFAKTGDNLWGWDFAAMVVAGRVLRVEEVNHLAHSGLSSLASS